MLMGMINLCFWLMDDDKVDDDEVDDDDAINGDDDLALHPSQSSLCQEE